MILCKCSAYPYKSNNTGWSGAMWRQVNFCISFPVRWFVTLFDLTCVVHCEPEHWCKSLLATWYVMLLQPCMIVHIASSTLMCVSRYPALGLIIFCCKNCSYMCSSGAIVLNLINVIDLSRGFQLISVWTARESVLFVHRGVNRVCVLVVGVASDCPCVQAMTVTLPTEVGN